MDHKKILIFKNRKFYFLNWEIPNCLSLRECQRHSEILKIFGLKAFTTIITLEGVSNKTEIILTFINHLNKHNILHLFTDFFTSQKNLDKKEFFLLAFTSPLFMKNLSKIVFYELSTNNNQISNNFYLQLYKNLDFEKPDKKRLILFLKSIKNPEHLVNFWLFSINNNHYT